MMEACEAKQQAIALAKELDIDGLVRTVAYSGNHDEAKCNYWLEWEGFILRATRNAGTNSASVRLNDQLVYEAGDYGHYIEVFRHGAWCQQLAEKAEAVKAIRQTEGILDQARKEAETLDNFLPLN